MSGHGHVTPNPDGSKARCGGPAICAQCAREAAQQASGDLTLVQAFSAGRRKALTSLADALDQKAADQHAEAKVTQRVGMEASARTITAIGRAYEVSAAMARRRAESGPAPADEAAPVSREGQEPAADPEAPQRVALGMLVRAVWVAWAREQPDAKPSWLAGWAELDDGQREVDCRIGEAVAEAERERIRQQIDPVQLDKLADWFDTDDEFKVAMFPGTWPERGHEVQADLRRWARVIRGERP